MKPATTPESPQGATALAAVLTAFGVPEFDSVAAAARYGKHPVVNKWFEWGETNDPSNKSLMISGAQEIALQDIIDAAITADRAASQSQIELLREALILIRDHPHNSYESNASVENVDGHRCAAGIARAAIASTDVKSVDSNNESSQTTHSATGDVNA